MFNLASDPWDAPQTLIAIVAAAIAIGAAIVAWWNAKSAKTQAESARHQVELMKKQVAVAEQANSLTQQAIDNERQDRTLKLDVKAQMFQDGGWWLYIDIENNSQVTANIRSVEAVNEDGTLIHGGRYSQGDAVRDGELWILEPGKKCSFEFSVTVPTDPNDKLYVDTEEVPITWSDPKWRKFENIVVTANNKPHYADKTDDRWFQSIRSASFPNLGSL